MEKLTANLLYNKMAIYMDIYMNFSFLLNKQID